MKNMGYVLLLSLLFLGCDPKPIYQETKSIDGVWEYDEQLAYQFEVQDTAQQYNLLWKLEHTKDYGFENLYLKITTTFPNQKTVDNVLSINLSDKFGQWVGACGSTCMLDVVLRENFRFRQSGKHEIRIGQNSRDPQLPGIVAAELLLFEVESKD